MSAPFRAPATIANCPFYDYHPFNASLPLSPQPLLDGALFIEDARTIAMVYRLLKDEGIFVGASSALNVVAAADLARKLGPGKRVVTVICDGAGRYQTRLFSKAWLESKGLYQHVPEDCRQFVTLP